MEHSVLPSLMAFCQLNQFEFCSHCFFLAFITIINIIIAVFFHSQTPLSGVNLRRVQQSEKRKTFLVNHIASVEEISFGRRASNMKQAVRTSHARVGRSDFCRSATHVDCRAELGGSVCRHERTETLWTAKRTQTTSWVASHTCMRTITPAFQTSYVVCLFFHHKQGSAPWTAALSPAGRNRAGVGGAYLLIQPQKCRLGTIKGIDWELLISEPLGLKHRLSICCSNNVRYNKKSDGDIQNQLCCQSSHKGKGAKCTLKSMTV